MSNLPQIKKILEKYNKIPKKSLGQNFLTEPGIAKKIAELCNSSAENEDAGVIEIGPGLGILTSELCSLYKKVVAVEIDKTFGPILNENLNNFDNLNIIFDDILKIDLQELIKNKFSGLDKIYICANLPYYITTPVILKLIKSDIKFSGITLMLQKEAADKLCSKPGDESYNATSVIISYYGVAKKTFNVAKSNFYPSPHVLSTVIKITPHEIPVANPKNIDFMFKVIEAAFGQRRKTLVNALSSGLNIDKQTVGATLAVALANKNIAAPETIRGEELDVKSFSDISDLIYETIIK